MQKIDDKPWFEEYNKLPWLERVVLIIERKNF